MKTNLISQSLALAVLSADSAGNLGFVACSIVTANYTSGATVRVQLLPDGYFSAVDGRPFDVPSGQWLMDETAFSYLKSNAAKRKSDYVIDYEHQTLHADKSGKPAPASGWFAPDSLEYEPGVGLFAQVRWTAAAAQYIDAEEYRYTSAVFEYDLSTGRPVRLLLAALTNNPAADGMQAVAALTALPTQKQKKGKLMNEHLKKLLATLGITVPEDADDAAIAALCAQAGTAIAALTAKASNADTLTTSVADLTAKLASKTASSVDLSQFVPVANYNGLLTEIAALRADNDTLSVDQMIKDAKKAGKILEAETDYLTSLGKQNGTAALSEVLAARPAIAALAATQTHGKKPPEDANLGTAALTADEKAVINQLGVSEADYLEQKKKENA